MILAKRIEIQIVRRLLQRRESSARYDGAVHRDNVDISVWADRLIAILAVTVGLLVVGSYLEELLWGVVAVATALTLR